MTQSEKTLYNRIINEIWIHTELSDSEVQSIANKIVRECKHILK